MLFGLPPIHADYTDYTARVAIVEGYSTDTYQEQVPIAGTGNNLLVRHASPFTGIDGQVEARITNGYGDIHTFRLQGRFQHYEPLTPQYQSDDGTLLGSWTSRFTLSPRTFVALNSAATLTSVNSAHLSDGTIFQFDPTVIRRTYWLDSSEASITHEISSTVRVRQAVGIIISGTISEPPALLPDGNVIDHKGLDFAQPYSETTLFKDLNERTTIDLQLLYQYSYNLYVLDLTQTPPRNIGPDKLQFGTLMAGLTRRFSPELINTVHGGATLASAPPREIDQRPVWSPAFLEELSYTREFWQLIFTAGYTYGSLNPRLGAGPSANTAILIVGTPYRRGNWRNFAVMINGQAGRSTLLTGVGQNTTLGVVAASAEIRYGINNWLGLLAGYDFRYATFDTPGAPQQVPPFLRHLFFAGFSGYWTTDKTIPVLTTFSAPIVPG